MTVITSLLSLAASQHGAIHAAQAAQAGIPARNVARDLRRLGFTQSHEGVWTSPGSEDTPLRQLSAALLVAGPRAAATAGTGLWLHGVQSDPPDEPHIVVPMNGHAPRTLKGVRIIASRTYDPRRRTTRQRLAVAYTDRCLVDLCLKPSPTVEEVRDVMITAFQRRETSVEKAAAELERCSGVPGIAVLRRAFEDATSTGADSPLARRVQDRLVRAGLNPDPFPAEVETEGGRLLHPDITFVKGHDSKACVECDGLAFHGEQRDVAIDSRKDRAYRAADWEPFRIGWWEFTHGWPGFLADLTKAINR